LTAAYTLQTQAQPAEPNSSLREQLQLALAVADGAKLRSLLTDSHPPIAPGAQIGTVTANISVPAAGITVDGVVRYELVHCILAQMLQFSDPRQCDECLTGGLGYQDYAHITRFRSDLKDLAQNIPLSQAIALLTHAGFEPDQISTILHLPTQGWYKSWWYSADKQGRFVYPFQRWMRSRHFSDGTFSLQYRDFYPEEAPVCFKADIRTVPVILQGEPQSFHQTLTRVNQARQALKTQQAILVCDRPSTLELQAYLCQNISVYGSDQILQLASTSCGHCIQPSCPLRGQLDSPVEKCRQFLRKL
ncbi:MAG: hypothetical protein AAF728_17340, partial [Cyanobacteria bacterium P01_D01_bin.128]